MVRFLGPDETTELKVQNVEKGKDAEPPKILDPIEDEESGESLFFSYWNSEYTNVTENRDIFAVFKPLTNFWLYNKIGNVPDYAIENHAPYKSTQELDPLTDLPDGYHAGWFRSDSGGIPVDNTPTDAAIMEDETDNYYTCTRYTDVTFHLDDGTEDGQTETYTLFCFGTSDPEKYEYAIYLPSDETESRMQLYYLNGEKSDIKGDTPAIMDIPFINWEFTVISGESTSPQMPFSKLQTTLENDPSPVLISGAYAKQEVVIADG